MVQETLQENGNSPAEFILNDISTFKVVLYTAYANAEESTGNQYRTKHVSGESNRINARQDKILALMNQDKYISVSTIARHIGCSARTIYRDIDCLKSKRKLLRVGDENNGYWQLLQENIENRNG